MADPRNDGNRASVNRATDDFFVETPQVFDTASAARHNDDIGRDRKIAADSDCRCDFIRRTGPLDFDRNDDDFQAAPAALENLEEVSDRGA